MISAKVICDSISPSGVRLTTTELNYPRFIHSEFMTHRMFSRNASSSRAIPVERMLKQVEENPAKPIHWGKNQPGMQAEEEVEGEWGNIHWDWAGYYARQQALRLNACGYHKQVVNRLLEPFQWISVVVTATEWDNFFKLRLHKDAQPEIQELAKCMKEAMDNSLPVTLHPGEWHLPYITDADWDDNNWDSFEDKFVKKISASRCARISYLNHDNSTPDIEKDIKLADMLLAAGHMSPLEHQGTPMRQDSFNVHAEEGITHIDRYDNLWSGNFRGWIQYRQLEEQQ